MMLLKMSKAAMTVGLGTEKSSGGAAFEIDSLGLEGKRCWLARVYGFSLFTSCVNVGENAMEGIFKVYSFFKVNTSVSSYSLLCTPLYYCRFSPPSTAPLCITEDFVCILFMLILFYILAHHILMAITYLWYPTRLLIFLRKRSMFHDDCVCIFRTATLGRDRS